MAPAEVLAQHQHQLPSQPAAGMLYPNVYIGCALAERALFGAAVVGVGPVRDLRECECFG